MITHRHNFTFQGGDVLLAPVDIQAGAEKNLDELIPGGSTDLSLGAGGFAITVAKIVALFILADRPMTLEFNSGSAPSNTITLAANIPFVWNNNMPALRDTAGTLISTNITGLFVTLAAGADSILHFRALIDPT